MRKSATYIVLAVGVVLAVAALFFIKHYIFSNTEAEIKKMLIAKYDPGSCYGMPGPDTEPLIELVKDGSNWRYKVEDGRCCTVNTFEGVVIGEGNYRKITEAKKETRSVPC